MKSSKLATNFGAVIAILSILFLPVVGCGDENLTGVDLVQLQEVGLDTKIFTIAAILSGLFVLVSRNPITKGIGALCGALALIIAFLLARYGYEFIELKLGAYIAIIGYVFSALVSFIHSNKPETPP